MSAVCFSGMLALFFLSVSADANLVSDGNFTTVTYTDPGSTPYPFPTTVAGSPNTVMYGEFGSNTSNPGHNLTVAGWATTGYNFVYAPNTADLGTRENGVGANSPYESPGEFNVGGATAQKNYGRVFMNGPTNGGHDYTAGHVTTAGNVGTLIAGSSIHSAPGGGNFIAMDGDYEKAAVTQTVTGLTVGQTYRLTFNWGGGQEASTNYTQNTTHWLTVSMGGATILTTGTISLDHGYFSGWYSQSVNFTATATSETLSFLAGGTPTGQPPFTLLSNVDLEPIPELSSWIVFVGFSVLFILFEIYRRSRRKIRGDRPDLGKGSFDSCERLVSP